MLLGMHSSGGSLLARCLHHLGVNFGNSIMVDNGIEGGVFENQDLVLIHEILFRDLGFRWDMVGNLPEGWVESEAAEQAGRKITNILEKQFLGNGLWAINEPRLSRVIPLWTKVLASLDINPFFVHMVRHPYEVACSLNQHHSMDLFKGHLLWLVYNRDALQASHQHPYIILPFDYLLADPISSIQNISQSLKIDLPYDPLEYSQTLVDFVRPDLKYHDLNESDIPFSNQAFDQCAWIYDQFRFSQATIIESPNDHCKTSDIERLSDLLMVASPDSTPQTWTIRNHTSEIINNLLGVIGRYEQAELDQAQLRQRRLLAATHNSETIYTQLYFPTSDDGDDSYTEEYSHKILLAPNEWQSVTWDIPQPEYMRTSRLRLHPLNTRGMVLVSSIELIHGVTGDVFWAAQDKEQFERCSIEGDGFVLSADTGVVLVCTGPDVHLRLPAFPDLPDSPMQLKIWVKASLNQAILKDAWSQLNEELKESQGLLVRAESHAKELESQLCAKDNTLDTLEKRLSALEEIEKEYQTQVAALKMQAKQKQEALRISNNHLKYLEELYDRCQTGLITAEKKLENNQRLEYEIQNLTTWMLQLMNDFQALEASRRWKFGNAAGRVFEVLRPQSKGPTVINQIQDIFEQFEKSMNQVDEQPLQQIEVNTHNGDFLINCMLQLESYFKDLMGCLRWKLGNAIVRFAEILLLRSRAHMATDHMGMIFTEFEKWQKYVLGNRSTQSLSYGEIDKLERWLKELENSLHAILGSRRWRVGNAVGGIFQKLFFRPKTLLVTDYMQDVFHNYRSQFAHQDSLVGSSSFEIMQKEEIKHSGLKQENELLLLQLHQVQDELEEYYLKYQKLKEQLPTNKEL